MTTPTPPAPQTFTHKPTAVSAIQFDGTVLCLVGIFQARAAHTQLVNVSCNFGDDGLVTSATLAGSQVSLTFAKGDWIIFPADDQAKACVVSDADFANEWTGN